MEHGSKINLIPTNAKENSFYNKNCLRGSKKGAWGTNIKISGKGFTAVSWYHWRRRKHISKRREILFRANEWLSSPSKKKNPNEKENEEDENFEIDEEGTYIDYQTPSGWRKTKLKIAFDDQTFLETKQIFYFFQIDKVMKWSFLRAKFRRRKYWVYWWWFRKRLEYYFNYE